MANDTTDFLTALASRNGLATGEALPAVQPRIPSRFEPASPDAGVWLMESASEMEVPREVRRIAQAQAAAPTDAPATSATPLPALNPFTQETAPPAQPTMHPALRVIERVVHARETQTIRVIEREQPTEHTSTREVFGGDEAAVPSPAQASASTSSAIPPAPQPIQQTSVFVPKPPATVTPSTQQAAPQPATPQPPDIHITIGRIEVRATSPAKKSEPARSKADAPNLERYLNSLSGGDG